MNRIGIFGTSGMAREVGDIAFVLGIEPIYVARDEIELKSWNYPARVILEQDVGQYLGIPFVIGIGEGSVREAVAGRFMNRLNFTNLIHPTATFGASQREVVEKRIGTVVAAGVRLTSGISVGDFCIFNQNVTVAHDCVVGDFAHISPNCSLSGDVRIGKFSHLGTGTSVHPGIHIGNNVKIAVGSKVFKDISDDTVHKS